MSRLPVILILTVLGVTACKSGCKKSNGGEDPAGSVCTPSEELIAKKLACQTTADCPCGTDCDLGQCIAECTADSDCDADLQCDTFGKCASTASADQLQIPATTSAGKLLLPRTNIVLGEEEVTEVVWTTGARGLERGRIEARDGIKLQCPGAQAFTYECEFDGFDAGAEVAVKILRATVDADGEAIEPDSVAELVAFSPGYRQTMTVSHPDDVAPVEIAGRYQGTMVLVGVGSDRDVDSLQAPGARMLTAVSASIWEQDPGSFVVSIDDPLNALTSRDAFVGTITLGQEPAGGGATPATGNFPVHPFIETTVAGRTTMLVAATRSSVARVNPNSGSIGFTLTQAFEGAGAEHAPAVRWQVTLGREGDAIGAPPTIPADEPVPAAQVERLAQPTPWEAAAGVAELPSAFAAANWALGAGDVPAAMCDIERNHEPLSQRIADGLFSPDGVSEQNPLPTPRPFDADILEALRRSGFSSWQSGGDFTLDTTETLAPTLTEGGIPCRLINSQIAVATTQNSGSTYSLEDTREVAVLDLCDAMRESTGCELTSVFQSWDSGDVIADIVTEFGRSNTARIRLVTEIERVCTPPVVNNRCAEYVACLPDPAPGTSIYEAWGSAFTSTTSNGLGDLDCDGSGRSGGFDFDDRVAEVDPDTPWLMGAAITDCLNELESLAAAPPVDGDPSATPFGGATCVDIGRMLIALGQQTNQRLGEGSELPELQQGFASAYIQRLLTRWVSLHGYLATQSAQRDQMFGATELGAESGVDSEALSHQMVTGWDLLLSQHVLHELMNTPAPVATAPDYRAHRDPAAIVDEKMPAAQSVAPVILQTLALQFDLLQRQMSRPDQAGAADRLALITDFIPRSLVAQALAADQFQRAGANPIWADEYERGRVRVGSAADGAFETISDIGQGNNPLGIPDGELPLYFDLSLTADAGSRFTAVSDFIAGDGPGSGAWAPAMVNAAQETLTAAREAYAERVSQTVSAARAERSQFEWGERMKNDYNAKLREYCGPSDVDLISADQFDAARCAVISTNASCTYDLDGWWASWTRADLDGRICMASEISREGVSTFGALSFLDRGVATLATDCLADDAPTSDLSIVECSGGVCLRCASSQDEVLLDSPSKLSLAIPESAAATDASDLAVWRAATSRCEPQYPGMRHDVPPTRSPFDTPGCVSGSLGEAYLDIVSATQALELARAQQAEYVEAYDIAMKSCLILETSSDTIATKTTAHGKIMRNLRAVKATTDSVAAAAGGVKDCFGAVAGSDKSNPISAVFSAGAGVAACVAAAVEASATIASIGLQAAMDDAQSDFESKIAGLEAERDVQICQNDARQQLVGARAATIALEQAAFDLERAQAEVAAQVDDANQLWRDGHAYLKSVTEFPVPSELGAPWYSERIDRYTRNFVLARRATYLAVRAVEYEFQASLDLRADVYAAKVPADLEEVLGNLWTTSGTRSIGGSRPTELSAVVSLRDEIFQAGDRSEWPEGFRLTAPSKRFQMMLTSKRFAEYDDDGTYLGQRIPFSLVPLGALGLDTGGVSLYADTDCAERLWSINASLLGKDLYEGSDTSFVRIDVLKRNTFFSQWCGDSPDGQQFQLASVTPTRNLFREPGLGEEVGTEFGVERGPESFGRARIQAFFGIDRAALEDPQYANGQTSELAGRGLYGDYAIFIPASLISRDGGSGLVLSRIEDILLRVDYLSVARP